MVRDFIYGESAQGMVEYGLIIACIALVVVAALTTLGNTTNSLFQKASGFFD